MNRSCETAASGRCWFLAWLHSSNTVSAYLVDLEVLAGVGPLASSSRLFCLQIESARLEGGAGQKRLKQRSKVAVAVK